MEEIQTTHIVVTPEAGAQIKLQLEKRNTPNARLRLGVKGAGCSGFTYVLQFEDNAPREKDFTFEAHGVGLIVDKRSLAYLNGTTLDWESTLMKQGFKISNPNEKSKCGCGHSFSV
jgi:iron-sulfur cluster assembly protein